MECQEILHQPHCQDGTMKADNLVLEYWQLMMEALAQMSVDLFVSPLLADKMRQAGFVNVVEEILIVPIGSWPKEKHLKTVGLFWKAILLEGIQAIALGPLTRGHGWTKERVELWLVEVRKAYENSRTHMFMPLHVIWGQRPPY
jgi:hypothetical protein